MPADVFYIGQDSLPLCLPKSTSILPGTNGNLGGQTRSKVDCRVAGRIDAYRKAIIQVGRSDGPPMMRTSKNSPQPRVRVSRSNSVQSNTAAMSSS
eukprot:676453-Amphidinium_carterae.1